jgi:rRNA maturation protein Nop10
MPGKKERSGRYTTARLVKCPHCGGELKIENRVVTSIRRG